MEKIIIINKLKLLLIFCVFILLNKTALSEYQWHIIPFNSLSTLSDVHLFDGTNGIIVGDSGTYLVTSNGGSNWLELPKLTKKNLTSIKFIDSKFGIITSFDTLFITNDGAKTWQKKGFGFNAYFYQTGFSDRNNLWVVGEFGNIIYSSDGGENWSKTNIGSGRDLFNIYVINKNKILVSGSEGYIARIINNGELIEFLDTGYDFYITSMYFVNEKIGFVSIDSLKILKTTDAGDSWVEVYKGDPDDWVMSFKFVDDKEGWAVSDMGLILKTSDGGNSWNQVLNTGRPLNSCFFLHKYLGFATGFMGTIYMYSDFINSKDEDNLPNEKNYSILIDKNIISIKNLDIGSKIELFNFFGERIFKTLATSNEEIISTNTLASGIYFITIDNKNFKILKF